jgi:predicted MFS family arabinose efflux permease/glycerophosphoryl diester phosphodiesterase
MKFTSAKSALIILTAVNFLNYIDRYVLSSMLPYIQKDLLLTDVQIGLLASAFMLPYVLVAPVFGVLGDRIRRNFLSGYGVVIWSAATFFTAFAGGFKSFLSTRVFLGLGEASFSVVAPAWLSDFFEPERRGKAMAIFSSALPVGAAIGFILGGLLGGPEMLGWRGTFMLVGGPGLILAFLLFRTIDPKVEGVLTEKVKPTPTSDEHPVKIWPKLMSLGGYRNIVWGYCAYTFVVGGLAHWMPLYMDRYYNDAYGLEPGIVFGLIAAVSGFIGTLIGGAWADKWNVRSGMGYEKVSALSMWLSIPLFLLTFLTTNPMIFVGSLFFVMVLLFLSTSPINVMILQSVPQHLRASAMALAIFACHFLGDAISSPVVGLVSDVTGNLKLGVGMMLPVLFLSAVFWTWVLMRYWKPHKIETDTGAGIDWPTYCSHRGWRESGAPENSLVAIQEAIDNGYEAIEIDLRMSKDEVLFLHHDPTIEGKKLSALTSTELDSLKVERFSRVLQEIPHTVYMNFELKPDRRRKRVIEVFLKDLSASGFLNRGKQVVSSFDSRMLRILGKKQPEIKRALLVSTWTQWLFGALAQPDRLHLEDKFFEKLDKKTDLEGTEIVLWTVNDARVAERALSRVMGVITDTIVPK